MPLRFRSPFRLLRESDLSGMFVLFWVLSLVRVLVGLAIGQGFNTEATLALAVVVGLPWLSFCERNEG